MNNTTATVTANLPMSVAADPLPQPFPPEVVQGRAIRDVYIWVLVAVGLPGNLACLVTVLTMRFNSATVYVALLAVADSAALVVKLVFHQLVTHRLMTAAACVMLYSASFLSCYANWVLALICLERFFTTCFPLRKDACFSKARVYVSIFLLTLALGVCFVPTLFFHRDVHSGRKACLTDPEMGVFHEEFYEVFLACLYFFAPFLLIAVFTTLIIVGLQRHRLARQRIGMARTGGGGGGGNDGGVERSISIMLLCAGLVFLLLTLPACLYHLFLKHLYDMQVREEKAQVFLLYQVVTMLSDINHAVNFIIYFLSTPTFRQRFMGLVKRCCCISPGLRDAGSTSGPSSGDAVRMTELSQSQENKNLSDPTMSA